MNDTLNIFQYTHPFSYLSDKQGVESMIAHSDFPSGTGTFLQQGQVSVVPKELMNFQMDLFSGILIALIVFIALLRWYMPERFYYEFSVGNKFAFTRKSTHSVNTPSLLVDVLYLMNFLFTISLLTYLFFFNYFTYLVLAIPGYTLYLYVLLVFFVFWVYRRIVIYLISFIFKTGPIANQQLKLDRNIENALSVLLLPLLLFALFSFQKFFLLFGVLLVLGMQVFRWFQTVNIGISTTKFSAFHFILYLCSLELIPMLIMIKLISPGNYF